MEERDKKTELLVGLFLFVGMLLLAGLILKFSSVLDLWKTTYEITVPFPNANGIKAGSPIYLGGSRVGKVPRTPKLNNQFNGVIVSLEIHDDKKIPKDAQFAIGTAGLLGDAFVEIRTSGKPAEEFLKPGAILTYDSVADTGGLSAIQETANQIGKKADLVLTDLRKATAEVQEALHRVNTGALSDPTLESFRNSMKHLESTMKHVDEEVLGADNKENLKKAIADLRDATASFKSAAASVDETAKKLSPMIDKVEPALEKFGKAADSADEALKGFKQSGDNLAIFTKDMAKGDGLFKALLLDRELRDNFKDLIANLKRNGVLFYRDNADKITAEESARKAQPQQQPQRSGMKPLFGSGR